MSPNDPRHGTPAGGRVHRDHGERACQRCRDAEARYERGRQHDLLNGRPRAIGDLGTRRRIQALVALGHSFARLAEALEMTQAGACAIAHRRRTYTRASTAAKVAALYDTWSMQLPPADTSRDRRAAAYARTIARKYHWSPPLAWDDIDHDLGPAYADDTDGPRRGEVDHVVVERILAGDPIHANTAERREVTRRWVTAGRSLRDLEDLTGWHTPRYLPDDDPRRNAA